MACLVGITGGSGSGKSTLAHFFAHRFAGHAVVLEMDWYYRDLAHLPFEDRCAVNFDHPDALEIPRLVNDLDRLRRNLPVDVPQYDFATHTRKRESVRVAPKPLILLEGILALGIPDVRALFDTTIYVDTPEPVRRARRLERDQVERGRTAAQAADQYARQVLPMHTRFVEPSRAMADHVVHGEGDYAAGAAVVMDALRAQTRMARNEDIGPTD